MPDKYDPDERFSLYPMEGEEIIKKLLDPDEEAIAPAAPEDEDS